MDSFLSNTVDDIKQGFSFDSSAQTFTCLICGKSFAAGEIYPIEGRFYEASKAVCIHVEKEHGEMLKYLTSFDKKYTGLTENQKELLEMMFQGMSDREISKKTGSAPATLRHQRFVFREKAKQAKLYLAIFELVEEALAADKSKDTADEIIDIPSSAKMVDDRYSITKSEEDKILNSVFESLEPLKLKVFSPKEKKKIVILRRIAAQFQNGRHYSEKEVNTILRAVYEDYATIRRYLIEYGFMERTKDCREYWLK